VLFFSIRRRHTRSYGDWSSDVCSSDLDALGNWQGATREWLGLGFARDVLPPTAVPGQNAGNAGSNFVNPNAILILQQPADRNAEIGRASCRERVEVTVGT